MDTLARQSSLFGPHGARRAAALSLPLRLLAWAVGMTLVAFFLDRAVLRLFAWMQTPALDGLMFFLSDFAGPLAILAMSFFLFQERRLKDGILLGAVIGIVAQVSFLLKYFFHVPRPGIFFDVTVLKMGSGFSFPSSHATVLFALLGFAVLLLPRMERWMIFLAPAVAASRLYLGSHLFSDVLFGAFVGYGTALALIGLEKRYRLIDHFLWHIQDKFELRRQMAHALTGLAIIFLIKLRLLNLELLFLILLAGGLLSFAARRVRVPILYELLHFFERPHHLERFPGRGSFFLVLGAFLSLLLFPELVALAAIAIVAFGDSVNNIVGRYFGRIKLPWNNKKHLEGLLFSILISTMVAAYFVPLYPALLASIVAMVLETFPVRIRWLEIDDNVLVPLAAGVAMVVVM